MATIIKNTIFTNVAETSDGGVYWEGMDESLPEGVTVTSWKNKPWSSKDGMFLSRVHKREEACEEGNIKLTSTIFQANPVLTRTLGSALRQISAPSLTHYGNLLRESPSRRSSSEGVGLKVSRNTVEYLQSYKRGTHLNLP